MMDPDRLAVMGDSAGGNLSAVVALKTRHDAKKPALQALIYPAVDGSCTMKSHETFGRGWILESEKMEWFYHCYVGDDPAERRQPDVSPLFAENFQGSAPALVYTAGFDPLRDEGVAYAERLQKAGIAVHHHCFRTLTHGFVSMGGVCPAARDGARQIAHDVGRALREGGSARTNAAA
jgi:acetyl esterase